MARKYPVKITPDMGLEDLPERQAELIISIVNCEYESHIDAAQAAGYSPNNRDGARSRLSKLKNDPRFQLVFDNVMKTKARYESPGAGMRLEEIMKFGVPQHAAHAPQQYLDANRDCYNRVVGPVAPSRDYLKGQREQARAKVIDATAKEEAAAEIKMQEILAQIEVTHKELISKAEDRLAAVWALYHHEVDGGALDPEAIAPKAIEPPAPPAPRRRRKRPAAKKYRVTQKAVQVEPQEVTPASEPPKAPATVFPKKLTPNEIVASFGSCFQDYN